MFGNDTGQPGQGACRPGRHLQTGTKPTSELLTGSQLARLGAPAAVRPAPRRAVSRIAEAAPLHAPVYRSWTPGDA